ncbi:MAG: hypothetical protein OXC42_08570 [Gammaproteobacteria bacterium]|nr:hypothetical protein [Gammaproteobacteria bacterium]
MAIIDHLDGKILEFCSKNGNMCLGDLVEEFEEFDHDSAQDQIMSLLARDLIEIEDICFRKKAR